MKLSYNFLKLFVVLLSVSLIMTGCGGGGTSGSLTLKTGVFLDSAVEGLNYRTATQSGITETGGLFTYVEGETITFSVGDAIIGQTSAKEQITPIDLVPGASDEINPKVTNICRLLQSLDTDGVPENGIQISPQTRKILNDYPVDLNLSTVEFEINSTVKNLFGELSKSAFSDQGERKLCTADQAREHFRDTLRSLMTGQQGPSLKTFATAFELEAYLKEQYASGILSTSMYSGDIGAAAGGGAGGSGGGGDGAGGATTDYSHTNIQEAGVDESDMVKTDGTYLYIAGNRKVTVVKAVPAATMAKISTFDINGTVDSLYFYNKMLAVLYTPDNGRGKTWVPASGTSGLRVGMPYWIPVKAQAGVLLLNVSNPTNPQLIKNFITDGRLVSSRLSEGKLRVIQQFLPNLPPLDLWYDGTEKDRTDTLAANMSALKSLTLKDLLPGVQITDNKGETTGPTLLSPADFYYPNESGGGSIVTVTTVDLNDTSYPYQSVGVVADAHIVYSTTGSLYVAATRRSYTSGPLQGGFAETNEETMIHKFDLSGGEVRSMGSGKVPGNLLNQFSMGEYKGVLRVATTTGYAWSAVPTSNHVFCLQSGTEGLEVIGKRENLAAGERIYSARFIGNRGFLVTFVQVDPLFTLDLSNPAAPRVVGTLKVPGYSDYIHPLDENHLITIGKDVKIEGSIAWYQGVQLSMFDITDFADPKLMHKQLIGVRGTDSEALRNHKAFTFWNEKNLLAIPIMLYEYQTPPAAAWQYGKLSFIGLYGYRVSLGKGFESLDRISTVDLQSYPNYYLTWMRGLFIGDSVYAVQQDSVSSAQVNDIGGTVKRIIIDDPPQPPYGGY